LTAAAPGRKTLTLATCDDAENADCLKKTVTFDFDFLDPDATRVLSFSPLSAYTSGLSRKHLPDPSRPHTPQPSTMNTNLKPLPGAPDPSTLN